MLAIIMTIVMECCVPVVPISLLTFSKYTPQELGRLSIFQFIPCMVLRVISTEISLRVLSGFPIIFSSPFPLFSIVQSPKTCL